MDVRKSWAHRSGLCERVWFLILPILLVIGMLIGCSRFSGDSRPIPDSTFVRILTEIHITNARHELDAPYPRGLRDSVLARYGVRPRDFDSTVKYYSRRPNAFKELYQPVIDTLQSLQYRAPSDTVRPRVGPMPTR